MEPNHGSPSCVLPAARFVRTIAVDMPTTSIQQVTLRTRDRILRTCDKQHLELLSTGPGALHDIMLLPTMVSLHEVPLTSKAIANHTEVRQSRNNNQECILSTPSPIVTKLDVGATIALSYVLYVVGVPTIMVNQNEEQRKPPHAFVVVLVMKASFLTSLSASKSSYGNAMIDCCSVGRGCVMLCCLPLCAFAWYDESAPCALLGHNPADRWQQLLDLATRMRLCWLTDGNMACHPFSNDFT
jgi:hypothetical protein